KIRDIGIQVAVNNVTERDGDEVQFLTQNDQNVVEDGIGSILNSIISTSIDKEYGEDIPEEKVSIVFQEFTDSVSTPDAPKTGVPTWLYVVGGGLLVVSVVLVILVRGNQCEDEVYAEDEEVEESIDIPDIQSTDEPASV